MNNGSETSTERLNRIFSEIAAERPAVRSDRWSGQFDREAGASAGQLVLFGTGELGRWVLGRLRRAGVEPLSFADNNQSRWGTNVDGIPVVSPTEAVDRFGKTASFVVTIYNGNSARQQLREMGCDRVFHVSLLFWKYPSELMPDLGIDAPERILEDEESIRKCFSILSDESSRHELCDQIAWRYWMQPEYLPLPLNEHELYFPTDLVRESADEVLVDCGAFDGDSVRSFLRRDRNFLHLYALEPDAANLSRLENYLSNLAPEIRAKITVLPYAVGDKNEEIHFVETHDVTAKVSSSGEGIVANCRRLDSLSWKHSPTYIKMDIEGYEPIALSGASGLLQQNPPVLAVCLYHRTEHLWQIPNLIHSLAPDYELYLRRYAEDCWEQVCYAVPRNRVKHP